MSIFRTISTKVKASLRRQHQNGDQPVKEEPAKYYSGKSVPRQGEAKSPRLERAWHGKGTDVRSVHAGLQWVRKKEVRSAVRETGGGQATLGTIQTVGTLEFTNVCITIFALHIGLWSRCSRRMHNPAESHTTVGSTAGIHSAVLFPGSITFTLIRPPHVVSKAQMGPIEYCAMPSNDYLL